jgi:outer membrane protein OmpA-like peptidoglycan-associated protein
MSKWLYPILGVFALGALTYYCGNHHGPMIEDDLTKRTAQALSGAGMEGIRATADGQMITLSGVVASAAAQRKAGELAASVWGVSEVRNLLEVKAPPAAKAREYAVPDRKAAIGCQERFNSLLEEGIQFAPRSAVVSAKSHSLLDQLASAAKLCPGATIEVAGYTDNAGKPELNQKLSERRAKAVVAYLVKNGVAAESLISTGYGEANPIADNATAAGRAKNRRTEFKVKGL